MASRPPPRFIVRPHDRAGQRRRWLWLGAAWLASVLLAALVTGLVVRRATPAATEHRQIQTLRVENDDLKQQVANLQRAAQVNEIADRSLRNTIAEREEEISGLRADLDFYARLVGGDAQRGGLRVQGIRVQPIDGTRGWNLTVSLTQNAKRGEETSGNVLVSVEGLRGDKVERLDWPALGDTAQKDGLPFRLKYFQELHATIVLPADFRPNRVYVSAQPAGDDAVSRAVAWNDAVGGTLNKPGDSHAQP
jgi:cell division protein FtsB